MRSAVVAAVIAIVGLSVALVDGWLAIVAVIVLVWATADVLLPVSYAADDDGITVVRAGVTRRHPWTRFASVQPTREGFVLVGRGHRAELRRGRTLLVRCGDDRDDIGEALAHQIAEPA